MPVNWMLCFESFQSFHVGMAAVCFTAYGHAHHGTVISECSMGTLEGEQERKGPFALQSKFFLVLNKLKQ